MKKGDVLVSAFDSYTIDSQIGEGGCGTVFSCFNDGHGLFAIKIVDKSKGKEKIKRFKNEISFCQRDNGPNVIRVIDYGTAEFDGHDYLFYVMPCYKYSLRTLMNGEMDPSTIISIFSGICSGLRSAHERQCVHRDLKPENILIGDDGKAVLSDFGIAHFIDFDKATTVATTATSRLANFAYHAPEQLNGEFSAASDIFALGLILNQMFTGVIPQGEKYKKIGDVNPDYSFLDNLVSKMISQDPSARYQSIKDVLLDYEAFKNAFTDQKAIASLSLPVENTDITDELYLHPIKILDVIVKNGAMVVTLNNRPSYEWIQLFKEERGQFTLTPYRYSRFLFDQETASYNISGLSDKNITDLFGEFRNACNETNRIYCSRVEMEHSRQKNEEIERRKREIERLNEDDRLNNMLRDAIKTK